MKKTIIRITSIVMAFLLVIGLLPTLAVSEDIQAGNTISFGAYEQDGNRANGPEPIEWLILARQQGCALLLSKYALDAMAYNKHRLDTTWESSTVRSWLNDTFYNQAFDSEERVQILCASVQTDVMHGTNAKPGNDTQDNVFLLSCSEAEFLLGKNEKVCKATAYAKSNGANVQGDQCWWWLRTPGNYNTSAQCIDKDGAYKSNFVDLENRCIRPAIWVKIDGEEPDGSENVFFNSDPSFANDGLSTDAVALSELTVSTIREGERVTFGTYEQDADKTNGQEPIEWFVVEVRDGCAMLLSRYALDWKYYGQGATWADTELCKWLNGEFADAAFTADELSLIRTEIDGNKEKVNLLSDSYIFRDIENSLIYEKYSHSGWIWALTHRPADLIYNYLPDGTAVVGIFDENENLYIEYIHEAEYDKSKRKLFGNSEMMIGYPTAYCIKEGAYTWASGSCTCWLETIDKSLVWDVSYDALWPDMSGMQEFWDSEYQKYKNETYVKTIDGSGQLNQDQKHSTRRGVRPVIWVQLADD